MVRARTLPEFKIQEAVLNKSLKQGIMNTDEGKKSLISATSS